MYIFFAFLTIALSITEKSERKLEKANNTKLNVFLPKKY